MPAYTIPEGFFADIDNGATWAVIVDYLCRYFDLPGEFPAPAMVRVRDNPRPFRAQTSHA